MTKKINMKGVRTEQEPSDKWPCSLCEAPSRYMIQISEEVPFFKNEPMVDATVLICDECLDKFNKLINHLKGTEMN